MQNKQRTSFPSSFSDLILSFLRWQYLFFLRFNESAVAVGWRCPCPQKQRGRRVNETSDGGGSGGHSGGGATLTVVVMAKAGIEIENKGKRWLCLCVMKVKCSYSKPKLTPKYFYVLLRCPSSIYFLLQMSYIIHYTIRSLVRFDLKN